MFETKTVMRPVRFKKNHISLVKDAYYFFLGVSWARFLGLVAAVFLFVNLLFGLLYYETGGISNAVTFADHFFFSTYTISTIGYGDMHPVTFWAHIIVTIEIFTGVLGVAMITGLVFAKFSLPRALVVFSEKAMIDYEDGRGILSIRVANERSNLIADASIKLVLVRLERNEGGEIVRRFQDLPAVRGSTPLFHQAWTVRHIIDVTSSLYSLDEGAFHSGDHAIIVTFSGYDPSMGHFIHERCVYFAHDVIYGGRFLNCLEERGNNQTVLNHHKFHMYKVLDSNELEALGEAIGIIEKLNR